MATKKTASAPAETRDYEVLDNLAHDGDAYVAGDTVPLTDAQAAPLLGTVVKLVPQRQAQQAGEAPGQ